MFQGYFHAMFLKYSFTCEFRSDNDWSDMNSGGISILTKNFAKYALFLRSVNLSKHHFMMG